MQKPIHSKKPINVDEQVAILRDKGLIVPSLQEAIHFLEWNNFYRIKPYLQVFTSEDGTCFLQGSTINHVKSLYLFDAKLRNLLFKACHRIEIALRAQLVHHFSMEFGTNFYDDKGFFFDKFEYQDYLIKINKLINDAERRGVSFIVSHYEKYDRSRNPPAWKIMEILPLGIVVDIYKSSTMSDAKKVIAKKFCLSVKLLTSWLEGLTILRNLCAHHHRIFNQNFHYLLYPHRTLSYPFIISTDTLKSNKLYYYSCCLFYLLQRIEGNKHLQFEFANIIRTFLKQDIPHLKKEDMGFVENWEQDSFWI